MVEITKDNYNKLKVEDLIEWCKENGQDKVDWLKKTAEEEVEVYEYPVVKVWNEEKGKHTYKADKTQEPTKKKAKIPFPQLRAKFIQEYFPQYLKPKKKSFYDLIKEL